MKLPFFHQPAKSTALPKHPLTATAQFAAGITTIQDILAPDAIEVEFNYLKIGTKLVRTLFVTGYPRFVAANWLAPLINFDRSLDISMYVYPIEGKGVLDDLRRKITEMEAEINSDVQRGRIVNIDTQVKLEDARALQEQLAKGAERFYQFGLYITVTADNEEELNHITKQVQSTLGALLIIAKPASLVMENAFKTTQPLGQDLLGITRNMDTTSLATTFPFTSSELTANEGILYGINEHNDSLVIFDRFNSLENANSVILAKSGAGKSFLTKLEALRSLMFDTEVLVIDPEDEYRRMCDAVHGEYIEFSFASAAKINPFDFPSPALTKDGRPADENELSQKLLTLHALMKIMLGEMDPTQEAILDRALVAAYKAKGITPDLITHHNEPPLLEDLYKALIGMEEPAAANLSARLEKYVKGGFRGLFDHRTNVDLDNEFMVFGIKSLEDELRPMAMFMILDFIWTRVKSSLRRRILIVDEAWYLMKNQDSALFLYSMAKRARKYYLGLTTVTQDVEDFLRSDYGKAIVTNSSIQILMKQSAAAVDGLQEVFYLSDGEKQLLMSAEIGEGLFFAGQNHVAIKVVASPEEHRLITSDPKEILEMQKETPVSAQPIVSPPQAEPPPPSTLPSISSPKSPPDILQGGNLESPFTKAFRSASATAAAPVPPPVAAENPPAERPRGLPPYIPPIPPPPRFEPKVIDIDLKNFGSFPPPPNSIPALIVSPTSAVPRELPTMEPPSAVAAPLAAAASNIPPAPRNSTPAATPAAVPAVEFTSIFENPPAPTNK